MGALALLAGGMLVGCGSVSSDGPSPRELALERSQLVQVSAGLRAAQGAIREEVAVSRGAWPSIAPGLPRALSPSLRGAVARASAKAAAIPAPPFLSEPRSLTGPAAGIAGLYESYERLAPPAWRLTLAGIDTIRGASSAATPSTAAPSATAPSAAAASTAAQFARGNSTFYIDAIYDAHFNLSLVGKSLLAAYEKLGGAGAFGAKLPAGRLAALAAAYSIPAVRLEPHPAGAAKEG
jgi:hypothetical protein